MATKKSATKKAATKKSVPAKAVSKKAAPKPVKTKKSETKKTRSKKAITKKNILRSAIEETPASADCMCMQKRPNGKFYSFRLEQGRWVQSSGIPFPTKEVCEDACC
jgi:hypothetical protein